MDPVLLARIQFALTIGFHYIFPPISIGLSWIIFWMLGRYLATGDQVYRIAARFWIGVLALCFAMGVASGVTMEFQFGMNWARYSRFVGDIFGAPLAAEGIFAFFLESSFLGVLLFGERRVSRRVYCLSALLVALGSTLSAFFIIAANSWQQTPAGFRIVHGRAELTDIWAAVFNPSTVPRFLHAVDGALIGGAFFVLGLSAWFLLRGRHLEFAKKSATAALVVGFAAAVLQVATGHYHAVQVAQTQPVKLAAFEGLFETQTRAPLLVFGIPDPEQGRTRWAVQLPALLSIAVSGSADTEIAGLKQVNRELWPPIYLSFFSFHLMVGLGFYFIALTGLGMLLMWRKRLFDNQWFLWPALLSIPLPVIANELGWFAAEIGRQPWIVYGMLRTDQAVSRVVPAAQILASTLLFSTIYTLLFVVWIFMLKRKLEQGPEPFTSEIVQKEAPA